MLHLADGFVETGKDTGCPALVDSTEDFGNGWYQDHHFHYG